MQFIYRFRRIWVNFMNENPFLIGDSMTGGYGTGADILHDCTVAVTVSYTHLTLPTILLV